MLARIHSEFQVRDKNGLEKIVATMRNIQGTVDGDKNKMSKTTLDGSISVSSLEGIKERETAGLKIEDINRLMQGYIKVPKPILDYVTFCHQEDTLWMFSEGKLLKEKFDDIFQSSEYVQGNTAFYTAFLFIYA